MAKETTLTFSVDLDIDKAKGSIAEMQKLFKGIKLTESMKKSTNKIFSDLDSELSNFQNLTLIPPQTSKEAAAVIKSLDRVKLLLGQLDSIRESISDSPLNFLSDKDAEQVRGFSNALKKAKAEIAAISTSKAKAGLTSDFEKAGEAVKDLESKISLLKAKIERKGEIQLELDIATDDLKSLEQKYNELKKNAVTKKTKTTTVDGVKTTEVINAAEYNKYQAELAALKSQIDQARQAQRNLSRDLGNFSASSAQSELDGLESQLQQTKQRYADLRKQLDGFDDNQKKQITDQLRSALADLMGVAVGKIPDFSIDGLENFINDLIDIKKTGVENTMEDIGRKAEDMGSQVKQAGDQAQDGFNEFSAAEDAKQQVDNLKRQILDFFSIGNAIQIFKDSVREAFNTIKELDAVMTETAVVTDFSVGDMWDKLPEYSDQATKLGTSISSLYEATTLYYQQGLNSSAAMSVGIETMKMARIANMEAGEATQAMTAALRGFNMAVDEANATRVSDVYSELAAITAADTGQIATAMSKTASIASSANMEFETTAALLAQIIETTQEAPETAGTAMKTIIARFTEVKELFDEGMMTGEDEEGEAININKIDAALKTVGISLSDFLNGTKGIDDIFLELASKWDSLDLATQRYIATTAAGSRQQSRFIAMMSNYDRTMELVDAANNSAGSSQEQFNKTLESLDAKLAKLKNAWQEFTMGLANSDFVKGAVDALTKLLEIINSTLDGIDKFFGGKGTVKGALSWLTVGGALLGGGKLFGKLFGAKKDSPVMEILNMFTGGATKKLLQNAGEEVAEQVGKGLSGGFKSIGPKIGAILSKNISWIIPTLVIAGAVTTLLVINKALMDAQEEAKLEKLNKRAAELDSELNNAKDSLDELTSRKEGLKGLEDSLDTLVQGTEEWRQKLIEVNQETLSILERFSELAPYIQTGEYGQLTISEEGWAYAQEEQEKEISNIAANQAAVDLDRQLLEQAISYEDFLVSSQENGLMKMASQAGLDLIDAGIVVGYLGDQGYDPTALQRQQAALAQQERRQTEFALAMHEAGISAGEAKEGKDAAAVAEFEAFVRDYYQKRGVTDEATIASNIEYWKSMGIALDDYATETALNNLQKDQTEKNFINSALAGADFSSLEKDALQSLLSEKDLSAEIDKKITDELSNKGRKALMELYADTTGIGYYADGKLYKDATMQEELPKLSEEVMRTAIASAMVREDYTDQSSAILSGLNNLGLTNDNKETILKMLSQEGLALTEEMALAYLNSGGLESFAETLGTDAKTLADTLKMGGDELSAIFEENARKAIDRAALQQATAEQNFAIAGLDTSGMSTEQIEQVNWALQSMGGAMEELGGALAGFEGNTDALDFVSQIDWSNPINAARSLKREMENGAHGAQDLAEQLLNVGASALDAGSQMQYLTTSSDWDGISEQLAEIYDEVGEINASDVTDLAKSFKSLDRIMENTSITAGGMAEVLEKVQAGAINTQQLTTSVLAAASAMNTLDDNTLSALEAIEGFSSRNLDDSSLSEFIGQASTQLSEDIKKGYWGGKSRDYLEFLFGPNWADGFEGGVKEAMQYYQEILENNSEDMYSSWAQLASNQTYRGETIPTDAVAEEYENLKATIDESTGEIVLTGYENLTTDDLVEWVTQAYGVTDTYARLMVNDFKNTSEGMKAILETNDFGAAIQKVYESMGEVAGFKLIDESEISAIATLFGKTDDEIKKLLNSISRTDRIKFTNLYDESGQLKEEAELIEEVYGSLDIARAQWAAQDRVESGTGVGSLAEGFRKAGLEGEALNRVMTETLKGYEVIEKINGETITYTIEEDGDWESSRAEKLEENRTRRQAEIFEEVFADIQISINSVDDTAILAWSEEGIPKTATISLGNEEEIRQQVEDLGLSTELTVNVNLGTFSGTLADWLASFGVEQHATGIKNSPTSHNALTGEEGPELIWRKKGGAYLAGTNGPEMARIEKGDTVYTAEETQQIFKKRSHRIFRNFNGGVQPPKKKFESFGQTSIGNNGEVEVLPIIGYDRDKPENKTPAAEVKNAIENPFDKLYNLLREIDEELRQRERIERRYEKLLEGIDASADQIIALSREELAQLEHEQKLQEELIAGREAQIEEYLAENAELNKFANVDKNERGEQILRIDWDAINQVNNEEEMKGIEEYVSKLEEWFDELVNAEEALWDIEDAVSEIKERGKEEYTELEDTIKEALVNAYQKEIDKLSEINQSIEDSNSSLLDAINETIDLQRQTRDNQDKERELAEKQRRLSYLEQDTSGANDLEILQLRKELEEGQRDYTDELIDQKMDELSKQNEEAAKAREQQITLLQAQLDHYVESGQIWTEVYDLMRSGLDEKTGLIRGSRLEEILQNEDNFDGLSAIGKQNWWIELNNQIAQALAYLEVGRQLEDIGVAEGTRIQFTGLNGEKLSGVVNAEGDVVTDTGEVYDNVFQGANGEYFAKENKKPVEEPEEETPVIVPKDNPYGIASETKDYSAKRGNVWGGKEVKAVQWALNEMGYGAGEVDGVYGPNTAGAVSRFQADVGMTPTGDYDALTKEQMRLKGYLRGGLADFTGPAWLDGTKSRPELVLNARDTQNFIQLKDILSAILSKNLIGNNTSTQENGGDINYDIDINVETISSDYDVDQIADRIKTLISNNARYRNNNAVSLKR